MAKIKKELVTNLIKAQRKTGMSDKEIYDSLARRKDGLGNNVRTLVQRYEDNESIDANQDAAKFFGLDITQVKGNTQQGSANKDATWLDRGKSYAKSAAAGLANSTVGLIQLNDTVADGFNKGVNNAFGTNLDTNARARTDKTNKTINDNADKARLLAGRKGSDLVKGGANIAASLPVFMYGSGGGSLASRMLDQGLKGAAVGGAQGADNATDRLYNMAGGAAGGAIGQGAGEYVAKGVGKGVTKVINAKKGRQTPKAQAITDLGKEYDVPLTYGDITKGSLAVRTETQLERVPVVGIAKVRETQHAAASKASSKKLAQLKDKMDSTSYKAIPQIEKDAQSGNRNAQRVLGIINNSGDDAGKVLQAGLEVKAYRQSAIATKLYNRVEQEVVRSGDDIVTPTNTKNAMAKILDEQNASISPNETVTREITKRLENLNNPDKSKGFRNMRELRSKLGNLADEYGSPVGGKADDYASKVFGDIRKAVDDDIAEFAANSGSSAIKTAYKKADKYYRGVMEGKDAAFARAMKSSKPDEIYAGFIKAGKGDGAESFYKALDPKAQAALRYEMAEKAAGKAWNENREAFSPANFAAEFERFSEPYSRIFKGEDKKQMDGFVKLMRHVERAGQFKENPPTGIRANDLGLAIAATATAIKAPAVAIGGVGLSAFVKTLFTSTAGKNLLLAANKLPVGQQAALDNIVKTVAKLTSTAGAKAGKEVSNKIAGTKVREDDAILSPSF